VIVHIYSALLYCTLFKSQSLILSCYLCTNCHQILLFPYWKFFQIRFSNLHIKIITVCLQKCCCHPSMPRFPSSQNIRESDILIRSSKVESRRGVRRHFISHTQIWGTVPNQWTVPFLSADRTHLEAAWAVAAPGPLLGSILSGISFHRMSSFLPAFGKKKGSFKIFFSIAVPFHGALQIPWMWNIENLFIQKNYQPLSNQNRIRIRSDPKLLAGSPS